MGHTKTRMNGETNGDDMQTFLGLTKIIGYAELKVRVIRGKKNITRTARTRTSNILLSNVVKVVVLYFTTTIQHFLRALRAPIGYTELNIRVD